MIEKRRRGRPKNPPKIDDILKKIVPVGNIFNDDELKVYKELINLYMKDFDADDLSSGDMDDIMALATNKVMEIRLLESSKDSVDGHLDVSNAIDKLRKQNNTLKENLFSRRKDRINPNEFKGFSIVDLAVAFDEDKKKKLAEKAERLRTEEEIVLENREGYTGNRYDVDVNKKEEDEDR